MAFQRVPDTASFALIYNRGGDFQPVNIVYCRNTLIDWTPTNLELLAQGIEDWWDVNVQPLVATNLTLDRIIARDLDEEFGPVVDHPVGLAGTRAGELAASIACVVVGWIGDAGSAPRRGRLYHIGLVEADGNSDAWDATPLGAVEDAYTALAPAMTAAIGGSAQVIVSRFLNGAARPVAVTNTLADVRVRSVIGSQRRRRRKISSYIT